MSPAVRKISGSAIVVLGSFNPSIFQPAWFAAEGLITSGEAEAAEIRIVHRELTVFGTEYWDLECTTDRFVVASDRSPTTEILRDLAVGVFTLLTHTPMHAVGLNHSEHWELGNEDAVHALGFRLVPRENWTSVLEQPAMQTLTVQGNRPDDFQGYIRVRIEPSIQVHNGVFLDVNDHLEFASPKDVEGANKLVKILSTEWNNSRDRASAIIEGVLND
jgi:hypothetical protein